MKTDDTAERGDSFSKLKAVASMEYVTDLSAISPETLALLLRQPTPNEAVV
jgi:hypothetical protein